MNDLNQYHDWDEDAEAGEFFMNHVLCDLDIDQNNREAVDQAFAKWLSEEQQGMLEEEADSDDPNVQYVHRNYDEFYNPDCPACLRHLAHSDNEHFAEMSRVFNASIDHSDDDTWGSFYEG
jgi:hypothetical protein